MVLICNLPGSLRSIRGDYMFTGIVEEQGKISKITKNKMKVCVTVKADIITENLEVDDSVAINGICLTVVKKSKSDFSVEVVNETVTRTTLGKWLVGMTVNLERGIQLNGRLDGHMVQGHVDGTAELINIRHFDDNMVMTFKTNEKITHLMVEKGSVSIDGISLTIASVERGIFSIALIPYTIKNTTIGNLKISGIVNIETDIIGKYIAKFIDEKSELSKNILNKWGYKI